MYLIADELRTIANLGLRLTENQFDHGRYERVLAASARLVAALDKRSPDELLEQFRGDLTHVSPFIAANAAVFRDGQILLIRREDNGLWALPGGLWMWVNHWRRQPYESSRRKRTFEAGQRGCSASGTRDSYYR